MNKRRFRVRDSIFLLNTWQKAIQISDTIETKCAEMETTPYRLPTSVIPTDILYDLVIGYTEMYDKLIEEELAQAGYPNSTNTQH